MKKLAFYRVAIACFLAMVTMALMSSGLSFFVSIVADALGVGRGSFLLHYSFMSIAGGLSAPVLGKWAGKNGVNKLLLVCGVWVCGCMMLFSVATSLWMFHVIGFVIGLLGVGCLSLCVNVALQQSYDVKTVSALMGIVMAGSGVGSMIFSAVMPGLLEVIGWRNGYRFVGVTWLAMMVLCVLVMGKPKALHQTAGKAETGSEMGLTQSQMLRMPQTWLLAAEAAILAAGCGIQQQYPALLGGMGFDTAAVATMMSIMAAALALGKIGLGALYGAIGVRTGGTAAIGVFMLGLLLLTRAEAVYPALIMSAVGLGVYTTLMPLVTRQVFGSYSFAAAWGIVQLGCYAGSVVGSPVWGAAYDVTGSYNLALLVFGVLLAVTCGIHLVLTRTKKG